MKDPLARLRAALRPYLKYLLAAAAAIAAIVAFINSDQGGQPKQTASPPATTTVTLGGPQPGVQKVAAPETAIAQADAGLSNHAGSRSEQPPVLPAAQLKARDEQLAQFKAGDHLPLHFPASAPQQRGCTTELVRNYSSRHGVAPRIFVLHYTVSPNRPGWGDVNAVVHEFDVAAFQASSNYVEDNEGHCAYIVREVDKAWTQAAANPFSISVEVINTGHEPTYAGTAGLHQLAVIIADVHKRWGIPIQQGLVQGCTVVRPGIVDHHSLGLCGGGHFDITPQYSVESVIAAAKKVAGAAAAPQKVATWCSRLNAERQLAHVHKAPASERELARRRKGLITKRGYVCTAKGVVRH
jgi:N-acetylmuramoyl-L-alanine amidase